MTEITKQDLNQALAKALTAQDKRLTKKFTSLFATKDDFNKLKTAVADIKVEIATKMATKDDVEAGVNDIIQTTSDAFSSVPNRVEMYGLERRVTRLEEKVG